MLNNLDKPLASILTGLVNNLPANSALREYAEYQIKRINEEWHRIDATDIAGMAALKGQYQVFKQLMTLREDVKNVMDRRT